MYIREVENVCSYNNKNTTESLSDEFFALLALEKDSILREDENFEENMAFLQKNESKKNPQFFTESEIREAKINDFHKRIIGMQRKGFDVHKTIDATDATALDLAVLYKCPILIRALVLAGVDINHRNENGKCPIHYACSSPSSEFIHPHQMNQCIEALVELGADINALTNQKTTVLWDAANFGMNSVVKTLVQLGARVNFQTNHVLGGSTPLQIAAINGHFSTVKTLVELGADPSLVNQEKQTALGLARKSMNRHAGSCLTDYQNIVSFLEYAARD